MTATTGPNPELAPTGPAVESVDPDQPLADAAHDSAALRRSRRRSVVVSLVLVAIAATLTVMMLVDPADPWVQPFDDWWYRWIAAHRTPWLTRVADVLAVVGSSAVTVPRAPRRRGAARVPSTMDPARSRSLPRSSCPSSSSVR